MYAIVTVLNKAHWSYACGLSFDCTYNNPRCVTKDLIFDWCSSLFTLKFSAARRYVAQSRWNVTDCTVIENNGVGFFNRENQRRTGWYDILSIRLRKSANCWLDFLRAKWTHFYSALGNKIINTIKYDHTRDVEFWVQQQKFVIIAIVRSYVKLAAPHC